MIRFEAAPRVARSSQPPTSVQRTSPLRKLAKLSHREHGEHRGETRSARKNQPFSNIAPAAGRETKRVGLIPVRFSYTRSMRAEMAATWLA